MLCKRVAKNDPDPYELYREGHVGVVNGLIQEKSVETTILFKGFVGLGSWGLSK